MAAFTKKLWILFALCLVAGTIFITITAPYASTDNSNLVLKTRPAVDFIDRYHDSHMDNLDCLDCHHKYVNGKNVLDEDDLEEGDPNILCSSCHNEKSKINLTRAFHRECIGCHDKLSANGEKTGPSLCGECHIRQKLQAGSRVHGDKNG